jgi:hypothetical protein
LIKCKLKSERHIESLGAFALRDKLLPKTQHKQETGRFHKNSAYLLQRLHASRTIPDRTPLSPSIPIPIPIPLDFNPTGKTVSAALRLPVFRGVPKRALLPAQLLDPPISHKNLSLEQTAVGHLAC